MRVVFAGTPEVAAPRPGRHRRLRPRAGRRGHPARRPGRARPPAGRRRPVGPARRGARRPGPQARRTRATPTSRPRCATLAPDCCPVVAYGALLPAVRARHPAARLGQPALLAAAGLARRRAGAARDLGRRRGHRRHHVPARQGARRRADVRRDDRADPARPTPPATCSPGSPRAAPGCWSRRSTASRTARSRPGRSRRTGSAYAPKITVDDARVDWTEPAVAIDRQIRACTPAPGAWTTYDGRADQARAGRASSRPTPAARAGRARGRQERGARRHRHRRRSGSARCKAVRQAADARRRLGPWRPAAPTRRDPCSGDPST